MAIPSLQAASLFLVGFPGSGKSTLAPLIAKNLGYDCLDTDAYLEALSGQSIASIFEEKGEAYFRQLEKRLLLEELCPSPSQVIACGGGVVTIPGLCEALQQKGLVIVLQASLATLLQRLKESSGHRPLLAGPNLEARVKQKFEERLPLYQGAGTQFVCDGLSPQTLAGRIADHYKKLYRKAIHKIHT